MDTTTGEKPRRSLSFVVLMAFFLVACLMAWLVVRDAINKTVEQQALVVAEIVAREATSARSVYAADVADKLKKDGFGPSVDFATLPGHVPIPAQFLKLMGRATSRGADSLYDYQPVSKWNLEPTQGLGDDFLRWAWPQLERQDRPRPTEPIVWAPVSRFEIQYGRRVLRYLVADPASQLSCAACHNAYENRPEVIAQRAASGVRTGKQWQQHQQHYEQQQHPLEQSLC